MKKIQFLFTAALMMGFTTFTFAGTPKGEIKDIRTSKEVADNNPSEISGTAKDAQLYYWYDANSGALLNSTPSESAGCPGGDDDCAYGFEKDRLSNPPPSTQPAISINVTEKTDTE